MAQERPDRTQSGSSTTPEAPATGQDTSARLRADIDRGATGDKVPFMDPAAAPLGTDDEAAGTPPSPEQIARARAMEGRIPHGTANASARPRTVGELAGNETRRGLRPILIFGIIMVLVVIVALAL
ncbi:hypothetical protein ACN9JG_05565 [Cereibacter azotoformans]|uniref:hypothetical protein n=1 Tax=Cereibacter azotoformans TaxID=43057 RepID=UPI000C6DE453|nr:hypothetical protein [Cereibacter azotoformans]